MFVLLFRLFKTEFTYCTVCAMHLQQQATVTIARQIITRGSAIAEEPRDALRQLKYYGRFLTELLTRSSANPKEACEHTVS